MLFRETVAVYCENHTEHTNHCVGRMQSSLMLEQAVDVVTSAHHKILPALLFSSDNRHISLPCDCSLHKAMIAFVPISESVLFETWHLQGELHSCQTLPVSDINFVKVYPIHMIYFMTSVLLSLQRRTVDGWLNGTESLHGLIQLTSSHLLEGTEQNHEIYLKSAEVSTTWHGNVGWLMNNKLGIIWKETAVA
jgi:hypothetical protein